jgi:hypothetical protein
MTGHPVPRVTRRGRLWRGWWPDHNPLWRACDRVEAAIVAGLLLGFLIGAPLAALAAGRLAYSAAIRAERAQLAGRRQVSAVLLTGARARPEGPAALGPQARARWTGPDGLRHAGTVPAPAGARAGSTVIVWIDASGRPAGPPLRPVQLADRVVIAVVLTSFGLGVVLLATGVLARYLLDRRRLAAWDADWQATGPRWTGAR